MDEPRRWYSAKVSGLDIRYGPEGLHPLVGRRMPDLDLVTSEGPTRVFKLMHDARPLFVNLGAAECVFPERWNGRVRQVEATCESACEIPVIGVVPTPSAVLIRPDGHVAWVGNGSSEGLTDALRTWFGD
jgi:3-(3-hydroxy-phenyl)propionate hydroxylase